MFVIEDEVHAEPVGKFDSKAEAIDALKRLAELRWDEVPNACPCKSWRTCSRCYHLIEYDTSWTPWRQVSSVPVLEVSATRTTWLFKSEP
jgi:hypothetical protein